MKKIALILVSLFVVLGFTGSALAVNTGAYIGTYDFQKQYYRDNNAQNIQNLVLAQLAADFPSNTNLDFIISGNADDSKAASENSWLGGRVTKDTFETSGEWDVSYYGKTVYFYTLKAANTLELYYIKGGATSGYWELTDKSNGLSHMTFFTTDKLPLPANAVPIPASVFLFGSGLLGVVGFSRRKNKDVVK
ncbi:MAG: PEP-CTERM sorting domain-containing protein [Desulfamplus sp.]|nr:PEP-CTERM sorting domain-containing protein [Desulfamplus sp.]